MIQPDDVCMNTFLWERCPHRDQAAQTTTHRPEGGAPTGIGALITEPFDPAR